jgi:ubiquinone/menaquinone biosynthesis C-methylase UbiE
MLKTVDYDERQHAVYAQGRALTAKSIATWMRAFAAHAPGRRPLTVLDLGSGTGRFTPALAETFGGAVYGVEPSANMRREAQAGAPHPAVRYLQGQAEDIPLPAGSCDLVLMYLSFHHVRDRVAAVREIRRVLRPEGRVLIRSTFSDRMPDADWHRFFPAAREIELQMFPTVEEVERLFAGVRLATVALETLETERAPSLADYAALLRFKAISVFEHISEADIAKGFEDLDAAVRADPTAGPIMAREDLLVLG